jgi:hypothetical protein
MNSDVQTVSELIHRIAPTLASDLDRYADTWDLDEVFWKDYPKPWNADRACRAFEAVIGSYQPWSSTLLATCQIWLTQSNQLRVDAPILIGDLESLDLSSYHPPSVGLAKKVRPMYAIYEAYRVPVPQQLIDPQDGQIRAYYECFRTHEAQAAGEPYDRVVVFHHWS